MLVEFKGDLGLEGQACAFENDFRGEFVAHISGSITKLTINVVSCKLPT
jgi:hypothetical protein